MSPAFLGRLRARRRPAESGLEPDQLRVAWAAVSRLLEYPTPELVDLCWEIIPRAAELPPQVGEPIERLAARVASEDLGALQKQYVETFDWTRKCSLFLTYYSFGDTRKRGVALVRFKQAYRHAGLEVTDDELPDHLSVVLEFGATGDVDIAWKLLNDNRAGIELLRVALIDRGSPWADALVALSATLPALDGDDREAIARLLAEGPPGEEVGMDAAALDPQLNPHPDADYAQLQGALE